MIRVAVVIVLLGSSPADSHAQLKDVQDNGWSTLQDAYKLVKSMAGDKGERKDKNFRTALILTLTSMDKMKGYIQKMGAGVADKEDKACASCVRENILKAWDEVVAKYDWLKRAYEAGITLGQLETIEKELQDLQKAIENYSLAVEVAFKNYKAQWSVINEAQSKNADNFKALKEKINELDAKEKAVDKEVASISDQIKKAQEFHQKITKEIDDLLVKKEEVKAKMFKAFDEGKGDEYQRYAEEWSTKIVPQNHKLIVLRIATNAKIENLWDQHESKDMERSKAAEALEAALNQLEKVAPVKVRERIKRWDNEFPEKMSFKSLN
jgi:DNA repair exonuclease SbcCD ATPase subunit